MNPEDIKAVFGMKPEAAVAYLKQKGIAVSWDWQDMLDDAHATAFTVAKTAKMDVLSDIYSAVVDAATRPDAGRVQPRTRPRSTAQRLVGQAGSSKSRRRNPKRTAR